MVPTSSALEGEVLTTGPPGKSQPTWLLSYKCTCQHREKDKHKDTYNSFLTVSSLSPPSRQMEMLLILGAGCAVPTSAVMSLSPPWFIFQVWSHVA